MYKEVYKFTEYEIQKYLWISLFTVEKHGILSTFY